MNEKNEFKPYIPADRVMPELTVTSIVMGMLLAVIFGAANAYLGLRVGMTVSASIPAAVISMGVIRVIPFWKATWFRQSVPPESLWQQEPSLQCRLCSFGQKRACAICQVL